MGNIALERLAEASRALEDATMVARLAADAMLTVCPRGLAFACTMQGTPAHLDVVEAAIDGGRADLGGWRSVYGHAELAYDRTSVEPDQRDRWVEPTTHLCRRGQWSDNPILQVAQSYGVWAMGRLLVTQGPRLLAGIGLMLPRAERRFSPQERQRLCQAALLASTSLRVASLLAASGRPSSALEAFVTSSNDAAVLVSNSGTIFEATPGAERLLRVDPELRAAIESMVRGSARDKARSGSHALEATPVDVPGIGSATLVLLSARGPALTGRQSAIVELVARGLTNAQIATQLGVRPSTIKTVLERLYALYGVRSRAALAMKLCAPRKPG